MSKQFTEPEVRTSQRKINSATIYSARVQEAMRYDKLSSAEYPLVMTILDAVLQGLTEDEWQKKHQDTLKALTNQPPDKRTSHTDTANRYEQMICSLKDLMLWPW
jgi:hypothetical protein